jgi:acyl carrier protein
MAKTFDQVLTEVNGIFRDVLDNQSLELKYETSAPDVPDWDSLNHIQLVLAIEKHFKIKFNFADLQKFQNVGQMCDNVVLRLSQTGT